MKASPHGIPLSDTLWVNLNAFPHLCLYKLVCSCRLPFATLQNSGMLAVLPWGNIMSTDRDHALAQRRFVPTPVLIAMGSVLSVRSHHFC